MATTTKTTVSDGTVGRNVEARDSKFPAKGGERARLGDERFRDGELVTEALCNARPWE